MLSFFKTYVFAFGLKFIVKNLRYNCCQKVDSNPITHEPVKTFFLMKNNHVRVYLIQLKQKEGD